MVDWVRLGADMEELATKTLKGAKRVTGVLRPMTIQPYRGFIADGVANVRARVREEQRFEYADDALRIDATLAANLLRWVVLDMPGVPVEVSIGDETVIATSNDDGFVIAKIPVGDLPPGWHTVHFQATDSDGRIVEANGRVVLPDPASKIAVVTDVDDTILRTGMTEGIKAVQRTLLRDAHGRRPIPGMPSLYRGLARGTGGRPESMFFYVSSTPWNLYDMLVQFLALRGFPRGPLFLTDWRPGRKTEGDEDMQYRGHKRARIRRLLDAYPDLQFVLIGDSGEHDRSIYSEFLETDADRIAAILIRDVGPTVGIGRRSDLAAGAPQAAEDGVILCSDALAMAQAALELGLIDDLTIEEVRIELGARF
jgi:phosphatidate phosphatase APP1